MKKEEDQEEMEFEIIFEPSPQLKADVIWGEKQAQSESSTE